MAYLAGKGNPVSVLHRCMEFDGSGFVTGQAGAITTALYDEAGVTSTISVTVAEVGTTGLYTCTFTPDATGDWLLEVTNPAPLTADGATTPYVADVRGAAAVAASAAKNLTTRARVKERLGITGTGFDDLIDNLVAEVSGMIQDRLGRCLVETTYTEYQDGTGADWLFLDQGPLVSITSVEEITYSGTTTRTETATTVNQADYLEYGQRSENATGRAALMMRGSHWISGRRNYKIVYVAGYATIPEGVVKAATDWVAAAFHWRELFGMGSKSLGDAVADPMPLSDADAALDRAMAPYMYYGVTA